MAPSPSDPIKYKLYIQRQSASKKGRIPWNKGIFETPKDWIKRFNSKYMILDNGCWEWKAFIHPKTGYGTIWKNGRNILAHRFSYEFFNGPIPTSMTVDHLCKNRKCVNPFHLDLVTRHENTRRSNNEIANNKSKVHCPSGHEYNLDNNYITKDGFRQCKQCSKRKSICRNVLKLISRRIHKEDVLHWL